MSGKVIASGEEVASHSIRANHELIMDLCLAKDALESVNNDLPDIFGLMNADGVVIRGNNAYSNLLKIDIEDVASTKISDAFSSESWSIIKKAIDSRLPHSIESVSLEVPIDAIDPSALYHWTFSPYNAISERRGVLYSFVGKDITKLRELERKLANIFAAIPLGVLTVNEQRNIEWPYSAYTEVLLGQAKLDGISAEAGIFARAKKFLSSSQLEGIQVFLNQIGGDQEWYDMTKDQFPQEIPFADGDALEPTAWRGLTYNPIIRHGKVEKVLVVVEDITERVRQRLSFASKLSKEQKLAQIIFDIQEADQFVLDASVDDIVGYLRDVGKMIEGGEKVRAICNALHGIKGVARTVNIRTFKEFVHEMESRLLRHASAIDESPGSRLQAEYSLLKAEWDEVYNYIKLLRRPSDDEAPKPVARALEYEDVRRKQQDLLTELAKLNRLVPLEGTAILEGIRANTLALSCVPLNSISDKLQVFVASVAKKLGKEVALKFETQTVSVDISAIPSLMEIFYHLITNAVDHGVEAPGLRREMGKAEQGAIHISCSGIGEKVKFRFEDDGSGVDTTRVRNKAIQVGLITEDAVLTECQVWNLIICHGFSTAEQVTDTSGRGIGLDAVDEKIKKLGGAGLKISSSVRGKGTVFEFEVLAYPV